jgi:hypothetical protein
MKKTLKPLIENVVPIDTTRFKCEISYTCADCGETYCAHCRSQCPKCGATVVQKFWRSDSPGVQDLCLVCEHDPTKCDTQKAVKYKEHPKYQQGQFAAEYDSMIYICQKFRCRPSYQKFFKFI